MELSNWAPEHSDALRELVCKGLSYAEAARVINQRFNTDYSRSAALGRARRLGLGPEDRPQPTMPAGPTDPVAIAAPRAAGYRSLELPWPGRHRAAARLPGRSGKRGLPLPLWRRRRGRGHHLLRPSEAPGFELLRAPSPFELRPAAADWRRRTDAIAPPAVLRRAGRIAISHEHSCSCLRSPANAQSQASKALRSGRSA
jgi:GcrA cell cycle regulator